MTTNKQAGNVVQWIILGIVVIGVAIAIIWRYNEANKAQDAADQAANNQSNVTPQAKAEVELPDADAKLVYSAEKYGTLTVERTNPESAQDTDTYVVRSSKKAQSSFECNGEPEGDVLGAIYRSTSSLGTDLVTFDETHYFRFDAGYQNLCVKEEGANTLGKAFLDEFKTILKESTAEQ